MILNAFVRSLAVVTVMVLFSACSQDSDVEPLTEAQIENGCKDVSGQQKDACRLALFDKTDPIEIVDSPATGVALGWGWNKGDSQAIPTICVEFVPGEEPAQTRYMTMQEVNDSHELMKSLGMSAEGSVKSVAYEVSGKASFAKDTKLSSQQSTFVLNAVVQNGVRYASPMPDEDTVATEIRPLTTGRGGTSGSIRLTREALAHAHDSLATFQRICGSSFVSAIYGGAKIAATISVKAESKTEKEAASAELSGKGWGARLKSKVRSGKTETNASDRMDISIFQTGGAGDAIPTSKEDLLAKLETLSMDAYTAPKDFHIALTPYEILENWPGKPMPDQEDEFEELGSYWGAYNTLYHEIELILADPASYHELSLDQDSVVVMAEVSCQSERKLQEDLSKKILSLAAPGMKPEQAVQLMSELNGAKQALEACLAKKAFPEVLQTAVDLVSLRELQDDVLEELQRIELDAQECSEQTNSCEFEAGSYTDPYELRIRLPLPVAANIRSVDDAIYHNIGRFAKNRCEESANQSGCVSNEHLYQIAAGVGWVKDEVEQSQ